MIYKPNPIRLPKGFGKRTFNDNILQIGFAARLEKMLKRTHLLPEIIDACMFKKLDIRFNIAGEGQCLDFLKNYVSRNHLEDRVHILGWISPTDMAGFLGQAGYLFKRFRIRRNESFHAGSNGMRMCSCSHRCQRSR